MKDITIIIPAYNEEERIKATLSRYLTFYSGIERVEFIVVLNGCRDRTDKVIDVYIQKFPGLIKKELFALPIGKGGALIEGMMRSEGNVVAYTDADGSTPPEELYKLIQIIQQNQADLAIGSRWIEGAKVFPKQPIKRRIASRCFNFLIKSLFSIPFKDTQCPAKAMSRQLLTEILADLHISDMAFDVNLIISALRKGARIVEVPICWQDKEGSKVKLFRTSLLMFMSIIRLRLYYSPFCFLIPVLHPLVEPIRKSLSGWSTCDYKKIKNLTRRKFNFNQISCE